MRCQCPTLALLLLLGSLVCLPLLASAQGFCAYRMREHATDCTLLTDGRLCDLCFEQDSSRLFVCQPTVAGETCSGVEWKEAVFTLTDAAVPDTITASNYLPLAGGTLTGQLTTSPLGIELTESDTNPTCSAGNFSLFADLSEAQLKQCVNGVVSTIGSGGGTIPASAAPVVDAVGEIALDTDLWGNSHGALVFYDGLMTIKSLGFPAAEVCAPGDIPKFDADTSTWGCAADDIGQTFPTGDDATLAYLPALAGETAWYTGINNDSVGDNDDCFEFRTNATPGTAVIMSICPDGTVSTPASNLTGFQLEMFEDSDFGTGSILFGIGANIANVQKDCRFDANGQMPATCVAGGGSGTDANAVHVNASGEIAGVADKATPVEDDHLLIEDSEATNAKKDITIGSLTSVLATDAELSAHAIATTAVHGIANTALLIKGGTLTNTLYCTWDAAASEIDCNSTSSGSASFSALSTGANTTATMTVGTGARIEPSGTGIIIATSGATGFTVGTLTDPADTGGTNFDNNAAGPCWEASPTGTDVCLVANAAEQLSVTGGTLDLSAAKVSGTVTRSMYLRADAFYVQGNCTLVTDTAPISAGLVHPYITCADATGDNFHTNFLMPDCWDAGTVTVEAMAWISTATGTTTLNWSGESVADNETVGTDISDTGGQNTTFTHTSYAANDEAHVTSPAITVNGAGAGEHLYLEARTTAFTAGFKFGGAKLEYGCNQSGD